MPKREDVKHIGLRVTPQIHQKFQYIAGCEGRSINGQAYYLIQKYIREFEKENGPISPDDITLANFKP